MFKSAASKFATSIVLVAILVISGLVLIWKTPDSNDSESPYDEPKENTLTSDTLPVQNDPVALAKKKTVDDWLSQNAATMNSFSPDTQTKLEAYISKLDTADLYYLKEVVLDKARPANQRILSNYILGETAHLTILTDVIQAPMDLVPNPPVHSTDEIANGREKALRVMAIDQLIQKAKNDPTFRSELKKIISGIKDPWVKSYAERQFKAIS